MGRKIKYVNNVKPKPITNWDDVPIVFDIPMAARILGKSLENIQRRCKNGDFDGCAFRDGKDWRFEKTAFIEYIRRNSVTSPGE